MATGLAANPARSAKLVATARHQPSPAGSGFGFGSGWRRFQHAGAMLSAPVQQLDHTLQNRVIESIGPGVADGLIQSGRQHLSHASSQVEHLGGRQAHFRCELHPMARVNLFESVFPPIFVAIFSLLGLPSYGSMLAMS